MGPWPHSEEWRGKDRHQNNPEHASYMKLYGVFRLYWGCSILPGASVPRAMTQILCARTWFSQVAASIKTPVRACPENGKFPNFHVHLFPKE